MKKFSIFNIDKEQIMPVSSTEAVFDKNGKNVDEKLDIKVEAIDMELSGNSNLGDSPVPGMSNEVRSILEAIIINDSITLEKDKWIYNSETKLYEYIIEEELVLKTSLVNVYFDEENSELYFNSNILSNTKSEDGKFKLFATEQPVVDIYCNYNIQPPASESSGSPASSKISTELFTEMDKLKGMMSNLVVKGVQLEAEESDWERNDNTGLYELKVDNGYVTNNSIVNVEISPSTLDIAIESGVQGYTSTYENGFIIYSLSIPKKMIFNYIIYNPYS